MRAGPRAERGSAVPFAVACLGLVLLVGAAVGVVVAMVVAHRRAQSAADLAALAGATAVQHHTDACTAASRSAVANGARLGACAVAGQTVTVTVSMPGPHWLGQRADLAAQARAGPG